MSSMWYQRRPVVGDLTGSKFPATVLLFLSLKIIIHFSNLIHLNQYNIKFCITFIKLFLTECMNKKSILHFFADNKSKIKLRYRGAEGITCS